MGASDAPTEQGQSVEEMLQQLLADQQAHRAEVAQLRDQLNSAKAPAPSGAPARVQSPQELRQARIEEMQGAEFYCPGCGRVSNYPRECTGRAEAPHPPIEVVKTSEFNPDDPDTHVAAPSTENLG